MYHYYCEIFIKQLNAKCEFKVKNKNRNRNTLVDLSLNTLPYHSLLVTNHAYIIMLTFEYWIVWRALVVVGVRDSSYCGVQLTYSITDVWCFNNNNVLITLDRPNDDPAGVMLYASDTFFHAGHSYFGLSGIKKNSDIVTSTHLIRYSDEILYTAHRRAQNCLTGVAWSDVPTTQQVRVILVPAV